MEGGVIVSGESIGLFFYCSVNEWLKRDRKKVMLQCQFKINVLTVMLILLHLLCSYDRV